MVMEVNVDFISRIEDYHIIGKAFSGSDALKLLKNRNDIDLVLLDYFLPDTDGLSLLKEIRALNLPVDVIFVTANRSLDHIQQIKRLGAVDYIFKPFSFSRIQSALIQYTLIRHKFKNQESIDQSELDIIMGVRNLLNPIKGSSSLPKGLNERTLQQIQRFMSEQKEYMSAEDIACGTGLARVTVRRYLEYMASKGAVNVEVQYGSIGRPVNLYRV